MCMLQPFMTDSERRQIYRRRLWIGNQTHNTMKSIQSASKCLQFQVYNFTFEQQIPPPFLSETRSVQNRVQKASMNIKDALRDLKSLERAVNNA